MKTLIISDVHANIVALEALWQKERDADLIVFAGDVVDYGIHPRECIDWMIDKNVTAVTGNHDLGVIDAYDHPDEHGPLTWRVENARKLNQNHIDYLKQLPDRLILNLDGNTYGITHAYRGYDVIRSAEAFMHFGNTHFSENLHKMIFGHTHRRELLYLSDEDCWLNPGSVSYRRADENLLRSIDLATR